uniref:YlbF family regulator n=1 Tax=Acetatifactor sp. TaxID=1872090 RepID=UPI004057C355
MSKIDNALEQLIATILDSEIYREFDLQRDKVNQYPELKAQIDEFRHKNFQLQTSDEYGFDKVDQFEKEYEELMENSLVSDFLEAELAFCRMMQDINMRLTEAVDFE